MRELKNIIERALIESQGEAIRLRHLHFPVPGGEQASSPETSASLPELPLDIDRAIAETERRVVGRALELSDGNVSAATRLLNTNRNRVYRILGRGKGDAAEGDD